MDPLMATIIFFGGNFAPRGWAFCWGQILSIQQNSALFSLLGTTYGGNGVTTFALPDFRGRVPVGVGQGPGLPNFSLGEVSGSVNRTLLITQIPAHFHQFSIPGSTDAGTTAVPTGAFPANTGALDKEYATTSNTVMSTGNTAIAGGSQPFDIMQPYLGMNYIIATEGVYPSRN